MSEKDSLLKRPIIPIETWLESEYYLGPEAKAIRPYWKEKIKEFYNDPVKKSFLFTGSMRSGKCVPGNTRIVTSSGYHRIVDSFSFVEGPQVYHGESQVLNDKGWVDVSATYSESNSRVRTLTHEFHRSISGTPEHPVLSWSNGEYSLHKIGDLKIGDYLAFNLKPVEFSSKADPDKFYALGLWIGDGCCIVDPTDTRDFCFLSAQKDLVIKFCSCLGLENYKIRTIAPRREGYVHQYEVRFDRNNFIGKTIDHVCNAYNKTVPEIVFSSSIEERVAFIQGILDTDGWIEGGTFHLDTASKDLRDSMCELFETLGIRTLSYFKYTSCNGKKFPVYRMSVVALTKNVNELFSYPGYKILPKEIKNHSIQTGEVPVTSDEIDDLLSKNKYSSPHKKRGEKPTLVQLQNSYSHHLRKLLSGVSVIKRETIYKLIEYKMYVPESILKKLDFSWEKVVSDEYSVQTVYDITVPDGHTFYAQGLLNHNTYVAIILIIRFIYEISCYKNYPSIFGLSPTTLPKVMFFSYSKGKADSTGISRILRILEKIPYFSNPETTYNRDLHSKVSFPYVEIISGVSEAHAIGEDMLGAVLDESNVRHTAKANVLEDAQKLYTEIQARSQMTYSKNGVWGGFTGIISSTKYTSSFTQVKIDQARDGNDDSLFIVEAALYDANPTGFSKERFDVYVGGSSEIPSFIVEDADDDIKNQVNSATGLSFEAFLKQNEEWVIHVPRSVKNIYKNDIDYALMNISGIARSARSNFIKNRKLIDQLFKKDVKSPLIFENPLIGIRDTMDPDDYIDWSVIDEHYQGQPVYIHADLSKSNDRSGFSALYYDRDANKIRPIVVCALYHDRSIPDNPIDTTKAFELVKAMTNHGIYVRVVSADMASSDYFLQQAKLLYGKDPVTGVERSQYQSVDRTSNAYFTMLMFMRKDMIDLYEYPQLRKELSELIYDREADKVDHPSNPDSQNPIHWKDISDSLAGACYHISLMEKLDMSSQELVQSPLVNSQEKSDDFYGSDLFKSDGFYDNLADEDESTINSKSSPLDLNTFEQQYYGGRYV